jgi:CspA family cold shock protein
MGRGNNYRDKRRDFEGGGPDFWPGEYAPPPPRDSRGPSSTGGGFGAPAAGPGREAEARVKWFNSEKGFGFVALSDGSGEAFLHIRPVEAAGHSALEPGTTLQVRVGQGQKGPQVTEVLSVDTSTAEPSYGRAPRPPGAGGGFGGGAGGGGYGGGDRGYGGGGGDRGFGGPRSGPRPGGGFRSDAPPVDLEGAQEASGTVKWYDPVKGFGFVAVSGEAKDLFVHRSVLERAGLNELPNGQRVKVKIIQGRKGREVGALEFE